VRTLREEPSGVGALWVTRSATTSQPICALFRPRCSAHTADDAPRQCTSGDRVAAQSMRPLLRLPHASRYPCSTMGLYDVPTSPGLGCRGADQVLVYRLQQRYNAAPEAPLVTQHRQEGG
jgi:hypothetical protein